MKKIRFTKLVASFKHGNCDAGEILECNDSFAEHCVKTLKSAVYMQEPEKKPRRARKKAKNADTHRS